jgi:putative heme-binding domain-containing protein
MARRVLFSRGNAAVKGDVDRWLAALDRQDPDFERLRLEALRLRQGLDRGSAGDVDLPLLRAVLAAPDSRARAAACRVVCDWADRIEAAVELLAPAVDDPAAQVRLEAVRALAVLGGTRAAELALHVVDHEMDTYLDYAARLTASELKDAWLPAVVAGTFADDGRLGRLVFAAEAVDAVAAVPRIAARLQQAGVTSTDRAAALRCMARLGDSKAVRPAYEWAVSPETSPSGAAELLGRMLEAHQRRRTVPAGDVTAITGLVNAADEPLAIRAIEVTAAWRPQGGVEAIVAVATAEGRPAAVRRAAITALAGLPDPAAHAALDRLATSSGEPGPFTAAAIVALVKRAPDEAAARAAAFLPRASAAPERPAVFQAFLGARDGGPKLAAALERSQASLPADAVQAGQQAVNSSGRPVPELSAALAAAAARASGQSPPAAKTARSLAGAELDAFVKLVREQGDPGRGATIYAREALKCAACHRIGDKGGRVGPNLSAIGGSSPLDYIIDSLLEPAKNAKEGYTTLVVQTTDGRVVTGIPISRSDEQLLMRDANDKEVSVRVADIDEESPGTSLMPAGLVDSLSRSELADLVRYLSELGR